MLEYSYKIYTEHEQENYDHYQINPRIFIKGQVKDNRLEKQSLIKYKDGSFLQGDFVQGELQGKGVLELPKMEIKFEGNFINGFKNGFGVLQTETKIYQGNFKQDFMNGVFRVIDKSRMTFSIQNYIMDKKDKYIEEYDIITKQLVFKGNRVDNKNEGQCYEDEEDYFYEGNFDKGFKNGQGKIIHKQSGIYYEGNFSNDKPEFKANKMSACLYQLKENKNKTFELQELKPISNAFKMDTGTLYQLNIQIQFQDEPQPNPEYLEYFNKYKKENPKISKTITPQPVQVDQESFRTLSYRLIDKKNQIIYLNNWEEEFINNSCNPEYQINLDKFICSNEFQTNKGELIIKDFVLPNNIKTSEYVLEISDLFQENSQRQNLFQKFEKLELKIQINSKKKQIENKNHFKVSF